MQDKEYIFQIWIFMYYKASSNDNKNNINISYKNCL